MQYKYKYKRVVLGIAVVVRLLGRPSLLTGGQMVVGRQPKLQQPRARQSLNLAWITYMSPVAIGSYLSHWPQYGRVISKSGPIVAFRQKKGNLTYPGPRTVWPYMSPVLQILHCCR